MPRNDDRQFARIALAAQVRVAFAGEEDRRKVLLDNLSEGGLFLRTSQLRPVGTVIHFEFSLLNGGPSIIGTGVIRRVETNPFKEQGMGVQFLQLNEEGRREVARAVASTRKADR